jgi:hypothetical protein
MLDRLFGRNKDDNQEPTCAACGRTLLPGEWAQTVIGDDGREEIICSLCAQSGVADNMAAPVPEPLGEAGGPIPVSGRPQPLRPRQGRESHEESDAFWRALKDKDVEIERLRSEAARAEAERQELVAQVSLLQRQLSGEAITDWHAAAPFAETAAAFAPAVLDTEPQPMTMPLPEAEEAATSAAVEDTAEQPVQMIAEPAPQEAEAEEAAPQEPAVELQATEPQEEAELREPAAEPAAQSPADTAEMTSPGFTLPLSEPAVAAGRQDDDLQDDDITESVPMPPAVMAGGALSPDEGPSWLFDAPPHQTFGDTAMPPELRQAVEDREAAAAQDAETPPFQASPPLEAAPLFAPAAAAAAAPDVSPVFGDEPPQPEPEAPAYSPEELAAEAETLMLLQRGADLLNVSPAPRKIAETSESLGVPMVHLSSDGQTMSAVLLWSMAWYEYEVDLSTGEVGLAERGYDDRPDLQPNAKVRADGTLQIAPPTRRPPGSRPAAPPQQAPPAGPSAPADPGARPVAPGNADIISKSLKGQRTDDEAVDWDHMAARDFDWGQ